jgi:receptor protein-tyrosine kinase
VSIIERAAELLNSGPQVGQEPAAAGEAATPTLKPDLLERAAGEIGRRPASGNGPVEKPAARERTVRPVAGTSRVLQIDRKRLRAQSIIVPEDKRTAIAESFRRIKRQIVARLANPKPGAPPANLVMVTSSFPGEGKTFCAINLAISMALEVDRTALLVDTDAAQGNVSSMLGFKADKGLMDVLLDRRLELSDVLWKTDIGNLSLMPAGAMHKHATELLASDAMRRLLHEMAERYRDRVIIFDAPPLLAASEASAVASLMGQIVVVVEAGRTSETALQDALSRVEASQVTGLLLNKILGPKLEYAYPAYYG